MTMGEFSEWCRRGQQKEAADPEARRFRNPQMEASRQEFMRGYRKETNVSEPVPMPEAPPVGVPLACMACIAETLGDDPAWTPLAVYPEGKWRLAAGRWQHHCGPGIWRDAVDLWKSEKL